MKKRWGLLVVIVILVGLIAEWDEQGHHKEIEMNEFFKHTNRLVQEKSPYLLQHAHNPVNWYPWGAEAFEKAKKEDKPIFLSIGYSTCHWCHVMEHESFENEDMARVMNENFMSIKVDREERPDVDQIYMSAVQSMTGSGGWPLSAFLTHELEPFWGGTYFPPESRWGRPGFKDILLQIAKIWKEDRKKLTNTGAEIGAALKASDRTSSGAKEKELSVEDLKRAYFAFESMFDAQDGGFGGAPKFPRSETISLLFRIHRRTGEQKALSMGTLTLDRMARGGIYDHLGGGFHRYSTDAKWLVPHFEKMLYDNALLAKTYLEAYQIDANPMWAGVARETLDYILRDMTAPEGGFYSAEDADSEGVEGKFYVWTEEELKLLLNPVEFDHVKKDFQVTSHGNFEEKNILTLNSATSWTTCYEEPLKTAMKKLYEHRALRIHPHKDDKILVSWNGLAISTMAYAAQVLDEPKYLHGAQKAADFILKTMWDGTTLKRRYREGDVRFDASLDDYSFFIQSLLDLYETDFDLRWYESAIALQKKSNELFWDQKDGGYFFSDANDATLIARSKDIYDGAVPSGNSIAALNLLRFYSFTMEEDYEKKAEKIFRIFSGFVSSHSQASPALLMALDYATDSSKEIVITGVKDNSKVKVIIREIHKKFIPNKVFAVADPSQKSSVPLTEGKISIGNQPTIYLCQNHSCRKPETSLGEIKNSLEEIQKYQLR